MLTTNFQTIIASHCANIGHKKYLATNDSHNYIYIYIHTAYLPLYETRSLNHPTFIIHKLIRMKLACALWNNYMVL